MKTRSRRRELLLEFMNDRDFLQQDIFLPDTFSEEKKIILKHDSNFILQDRFCVKMETQDFIVNPERIKGFKIETAPDFKKLIRIKTYLQIHEWIKDFENVQGGRPVCGGDGGAGQDPAFCGHQAAGLPGHS